MPWAAALEMPEAEAVGYLEAYADLHSVKRSGGADVTKRTVRSQRKPKR